MITEKTIMQGEDLDFTADLLDFAGSQIDLTAIVFQLFIVIHDAYGNVIKKFASDNGANLTGWNPVDVSNGATGRFRVFLYSSETKVLREGNYYVEVMLKDFQALYGVDDGALDAGKPRIYLFTVLNSILKSLIP
jgi:hypothetical protein